MLPRGVSVGESLDTQLPLTLRIWSKPTGEPIIAGTRWLESSGERAVVGRGEHGPHAERIVTVSGNDRLDGNGLAHHSFGWARATFDHRAYVENRETSDCRIGHLGCGGR